MNLSLSSVLRIIGLVFSVISLCMIPSLIVAGFYRESPAFSAFFITASLCFLLGVIFMRFGNFRPIMLKVRDGFLIVTLCWVLSAIAGSFPFVLSGSAGFIDAFFETCSGLSTTGSSIFTDVESLPRSILFWRSFTHWIGGMGILIFAIALLPSLGISGQNVVVSETPGPTLDKITAKMSDTAKALYFIYGFFTIAQTLLLRLGGLDWFDSLVYTFGSVGTGGFATYNDGISHFHSAYVEMVITFFMIICGTNFNLFYLSLHGQIKNLLRDSELRFYLFLIACTTILIAASLSIGHVYSSVGDSLRYSIFQTASIITTTGYATADFNLWPAFSQMMLLMLMFIGGCSSSTGGGLKVIRILVLLKLVRRGINMRLHPNVIDTVKINGKTVSSDIVSAIASHGFLYLAILFLSTLLLSLNNFDMITSFTAVITCLGNIGPGFALVGPMENFALFAPMSKLLLSFLMLAGRLELFTLFILITPRFWMPNH